MSQKNEESKKRILKYKYIESLNRISRDVIQDFPLSKERSDLIDQLKVTKARVNAM